MPNRPSRPYIRIALGALAMLCAVAPHGARAHPHAWIDLAVDVIFDAQGRVAALKETWLFDDFYTEYAMGAQPGAGRGALPDAARLASLMEENLSNLADYKYFTRADVKKVAIAFGPPTDKASRLHGRRIEMTFVLPFATPAKVDDAPLTYMIFDPSYYIEVLHAEAGTPVRLIGAPAGCTHRIVQPRPTLNEVARAAALDRNQSGGDGLGLVFAQRVTVQCPSTK